MSARATTVGHESDVSFVVGSSCCSLGPQQSLPVAEGIREAGKWTQLQPCRPAVSPIPSLHRLCSTQALMRFFRRSHHDSCAEGEQEQVEWHPCC